MKKILVIFFIILQAFSINNPERIAGQVKQIDPVRDNTGRLYLFTLDRSGRVSYLRQADNNSSLSISKMLDNKVEVRGDSPMPAPTVNFTQISTGQTSQGTLAIYGLDANGFGWISFQNPGIDSWSEWKSYITHTRQWIAMKDDKAQRIYMLSTIDNSAAYSYFQNNSYQGWRTLYGTNLNQIVCEQTPGRFKDSPGKAHLFALSYDGSVYLISEEVSSRVVWKNWISLGGDKLKKIDVNKTSDGRLYLFAIGGDDDIYERHQLTLDGEWSNWSTMLGSQNFKDITVTTGINGLITVFGLHKDGSVDHIWQTDPGTNAWSSWSPLYGSAITSIKSDHFDDKRMIVFAIGGDGQVYSRQQAVAGGNWEDWVNLSSN